MHRPYLLLPRTSILCKLAQLILARLAAIASYVERRTFIKGLIGTLALTGIGAATQLPKFLPAPCNGLGDFLARFKTRGTSRYLGGRLILNLPDAGLELKDHIEAKLAHAPCADIEGTIKKRVHDDFVKHRFMLVEGWFLPETSLQLSALMSRA